MFSLWVQYLAKGPRPDFNNGPGDNSNSGCISAPRRLLESDLNNGPTPGYSDLGMLKITTACTIAALLILLFFPAKCSEASFKRAQSV